MDRLFAPHNYCKTSTAQENAWSVPREGFGDARSLFGGVASQARLGENARKMPRQTSVAGSGRGLTVGHSIEGKEIGQF